MLIELISRPTLLKLVCQELQSIADPSTVTDRVSLDISKLGTLPLLNSIYLETLRLRSSITVTRKLVADMELDGYILKRGNYVMTPTWLPHTSDSLWATDKHSAHEFWPSRFLPFTSSTEEVSPSNDSTDENNYEHDLRTAMQPENFFPYGGGSAICPGRFFSKQEILVSVALLLLEFEVEKGDFVGQDGKPVKTPPKPRADYAGGGIMPPDGDLMVRLRRRW